MIDAALFVGLIIYILYCACCISSYTDREISTHIFLFSIDFNFFIFILSCFANSFFLKENFQHVFILSEDKLLLQAACILHKLLNCRRRQHLSYIKKLNDDAACTNAIFELYLTMQAAQMLHQFLNKRCCMYDNYMKKSVINIF